MSEETKEISATHSAEAVQATAVAQEAIEKAREAQLDDAISRGLAMFFDRGVETKKFIDIGRIPFICDDISSMHKDIGEIHMSLQRVGDSVDILKKLVFGAVAMILLGVLGIAGTVIINVLSKTT